MRTRAIGKILTKVNRARRENVASDILFYVAQDRQANGCLHTNSFAGRKNMEH